MNAYIEKKQTGIIDKNNINIDGSYQGINNDYYMLIHDEKELLYDFLYFYYRSKSYASNLHDNYFHYNEEECDNDHDFLDETLYNKFRDTLLNNNLYESNTYKKLFDVLRENNKYYKINHEKIFEMLSNSLFRKKVYHFNKLLICFDQSNKYVDKINLSEYFDTNIKEFLKKTKLNSEFINDLFYIFKYFVNYSASIVIFNLLNFINSYQMYKFKNKYNHSLMNIKTYIHYFMFDYIKRSGCEIARHIYKHNNCNDNYKKRYNDIDNISNYSNKSRRYSYNDTNNKSRRDSYYNDNEDNKSVYSNKSRRDSYNYDTDMDTKSVCSNADTKSVCSNMDTKSMYSNTDETRSVRSDMDVMSTNNEYRKYY